MYDLAICYVYIAIVFANIGIPVSVGQQSKCEKNQLLGTGAIWRCVETEKCKLAKTLPATKRVICGVSKICCPEPLWPRVSSTTGKPISSAATDIRRSSQAEIAKANQIAMSKCYEYRNYIYRNFTERSELLGEPPEEKSVLDCYESTETLVSGGKEVLDKEYPHMALLGFAENVKNLNNWRCGGSLISEQFILSAAHCTKIGKNTEVKWALLGKRKRTDISLSLKDKNLFRIVQRINHPHYKLGRSNFENNDITLYKLEKPIQLSSSIRPICLFHNRQTMTDVGARVAVSGWGVMVAGEQNSQYLQKAVIKIVDKQLCIDQFKSDKDLQDGFDQTTMICAGDLTGNKDSCPGDSGGPMQVLMRTMECMYLQLGVVSRGPWDCGQSRPAIYTNVTYYLPWIQSVVWPTK